MPMNVMSILAILVTVLGAALFGLVFLFVVRGNKLPAEDGAPHRIKYGTLEISTDRVVMLAIVFGLMMVVPLGGGLLLQDRDQIRAHDGQLRDCRQEALDQKARVEALKNTPLRIFGTVSGHSGDLLKGAQAYLVRLRPHEKETIECGRKRLVNREYQCVTALNALEDMFELRIEGVDTTLGLASISPVEHHVIIPVEEAP
jgi:hypothetical protein